MAAGDSVDAILKTERLMFPSHVSVPLSTDKLDQPEPSLVDYANFLIWY